MEGSIVYRYCLTLWTPLSSEVIYSYSGRGRMDRPKEGVRFVMHYLDDFLGTPGSEECSTALKKLLKVFDRLVLPVAPEKSEGPDTRLTFLGFELDTMALEVRLPRHKLAELRELSWQWQGKKSCSMKELESLVVKLAHTSQVVQSCKTFMRRMF